MLRHKQTGTEQENDKVSTRIFWDDRLDSVHQKKFETAWINDIGSCPTKMVMWCSSTLERDTGHAAGPAHAYLRRCVASQISVKMRWSLTVNLATTTGIPTETETIIQHHSVQRKRPTQTNNELDIQKQLLTNIFINWNNYNYCTSILSKNN